MQNSPIKIEMQSQWAKIFPYSHCLDDIFFRERDQQNNLVYELLLSTDQFNHIINFYYPNFTELHNESLIYRIHALQISYDFYVDREEECPRVQEFYDQLKQIENILIGEKNPALDAFYELLKICESVLKNGNKLYIIRED